MSKGLTVRRLFRSLPGSAVSIALFAAVGLSLALPATTSLTAGPTTQVCIALDGSGSIEPGDFTAMKQGLASAIMDSTVVPQNGAMEITVLQFGTFFSETPIIAGPSVVDSAAAANSIGNAILAATQLGGLTPTNAAIDKCKQEITGSANFAGSIRQTINISTDGDPTNQADTIASRDAAVAAGIDEVDLEAIGNSPSINKMLEIAYPRPGYVAPPFAGGGFVIQVATFADYATAIRQKLQQIIPQPTATPTSTGTITPTPTNTPAPTATATPVPSPTATPAPTAIPTPVPTPTPIVQNGGFENDGGWTFSGFQRTNVNPNSGGWAVDSTPGQTDRIYQVVQVPTDTIGIMLYFNWANVNPNISTSNTCLDFLQVKIMDLSLTQSYGSSNGYCSSSNVWSLKGLDFRYLIAEIRGKSITLVFEVQQDSQPPNAVFYLDNVVLYFYDNIIYVPANFRNADNVFVAAAGASLPSVETVLPARDQQRSSRAPN